METWRVTASDIKNWTLSNKRQSEGDLPLLIRKLIMASVVPDNISMPSGDSIYTPGWDGFVKNNDKHTFVPTSLSCWEMGTDSRVEVKATKDYHKRSTDTDTNIRDNHTFIFVTSRKWSKKSSWVEKMRKEEKWKDVQAYDADDLEAWLDLCPSVHVWFANKLGKRCVNVFDCEQAWLSWSTITTPTISKDLLLHSREDICKEIEKSLSSNPQVIKIVSDSTSESYGFSLAYFMSHPEYRDRILIIESQSAWNSLASVKGNLILIPNLKSIPDNMHLAIQNGHWVVLSQCQAEFGSENAYALSRIPKEEITPLLVSMGFNEKDAWDIVSETNGALMPMIRNKRLNNGISIVPNWLNDKKLVKCALAVLLMGKWDVVYSGDKEIACKLTGKETYESIEDDLHVLSQCDDFPCRKRNGKWFAISRLDLWHLLGSHISTILFDKYADCIKSVLGDCRTISNQEQKILSQLLGNRDRFSDTLEKGLIELLPIISAYSNVCRNYGNYSPQSRVKVLLREVFESSDIAEKWHHIGPYLSLFAEASPDSFLNAVETDLNQEIPFALTLFQRESSGLFGGCFHSNLLWGLEIVSWKLEFFSRAVICLIKLASLDPGGSYGNRPINTLNEIFCSWFPQTQTSVEERVEVLGSLCDRYPDALWEILVSILDHKQFAHPIASPKYQNWKMGFHEGTTYNEIDRYRLCSFDLLVRLLRDCFSEKKLKDVFRFLSNFPQDSQNAALDSLEDAILSIINKEDSSLDKKREIALILTHECDEDYCKKVENRSTREYILPRLRKLVELLLKGDLVGGQLYVFSKEYQETLWRRKKNFDEVKRLLLEKQRQALRILLDNGDLSHILDLSSNAQDSKIIGSLFVDCQNMEYTDQLISFAITDESKHSLDLLEGAIGVLLSRDSIVEEIFSRGLSTWSVKQFKRFLSVLPFSPRTYEMIKQVPPEVEVEYWTYCNPWLSHVDDEELVKFSLYKLLDAGRQNTAIDQACYYMHSNKKLDSFVLADILEHRVFRKTIENFTSLPEYHILKLFKHVHITNDLPEERLLRLELAYVHLFTKRNGSNKVPPTIWRKIKRDPAFTVELISYSYRANPVIEGEFSDIPENILSYFAKQSYEILHHTDSLPFEVNENYSECYSEAMSWITRVQKGAEAINRLEMANYTLGAMLSLAPVGDDGIWPHKVIRMVIEEIGNESFNSGFSTHFYNRRVGVTRIMSKETDLADQKEANMIRKDAGKLTFRFAKTAQLLNDIAASFDGRPSLSRDDFM